MIHSLRRARVLVLCGPLALGLWFSSSARAQDAPATAVSWTTYRGDAQRTGSSNAQVSLPLSLDWRYTSDATAGTYSASPLVLNAPAGQRVYFSVGRKVMCVDAATGAPASGWNAPEISSTISAPLTLLSTDDGDFIISASQGGAVTAFRATDGGRAWEVQASGGFSSAGPVVVQMAGGQRVVVASNSGDIIAITPAGQLDPKWKVSLGRFGNPPASAMALSENGSTLCVIATDGKIYGIDVKMGRLAWGVPLPNATGVTPVIAGKNVVTAGLARIAAYEVSGGASKWTVASHGTVSASPAYRVVDGVPTLFYGTTEGNFFALDARDGSQEWKASDIASFTGAPVVLDNMVLVGTRTGSLVALNPKSGLVLWQYRLKTERIISNAGGGAGGAGGFGGGGRGGGRGGRGGGGFRGADTADSMPMATLQLAQDDGGGFDPGGGGPGGGPGGGGPGGGPGGGGPGGGPGGGGPGGFGGFGGGFGGRGGASRTQQLSKAYSITAPPAVVNGQIFVQGDNAAMYSFTSDAIDADPPRVVEPSIAVPDDQDNLTALLVGGGAPPVVPGKGPFYFAAQLDDVGSGINTKSISVTVDGTPVDAKNVDFDLSSGILTVTLIDPAKGGTNYPDGSKKIGVNVSDYAGNVFSDQFDFAVDNTVASPSSRQGRGGRGRGGGGGNFDPNNPDNGGNDPNTPDNGNGPGGNGNGPGDNGGGPDDNGGDNGPPPPPDNGGDQ